MVLSTLDLTRGIKLDQEIREREKTETEVWQSKCVTESNKHNTYLREYGAHAQLGKKNLDLFSL